MVAGKGERRCRLLCVSGERMGEGDEMRSGLPETGHEVVCKDAKVAGEVAKRSTK